jgi:hypothetical protein
MKNITVIILFVSLLFSSCNQKPTNKIPVVGSLDSAAIEQDTIMQLGFESSYEFHKSIPVNANLVYDVVGYGGSASKGEFAILRRGPDNIADTVVKQNRNGIIADAYLNTDNEQEVFVVIQNPKDPSAAKRLKFNVENAKNK